MAKSMFAALHDVEPGKFTTLRLARGGTMKQLQISALNYIRSKPDLRGQFWTTATTSKTLQVSRKLATMGAPPPSPAKPVLKPVLKPVPKPAKTQPVLSLRAQLATIKPGNWQDFPCDGDRAVFLSLLRDLAVDYDAFTFMIVHNGVRAIRRQAPQTKKAPVARAPYVSNESLYAKLSELKTGQMRDFPVALLHERRALTGKLRVAAALIDKTAFHFSNVPGAVRVVRIHAMPNEAHDTLTTTRPDKAKPMPQAKKAPARAPVPDWASVLELRVDEEASFPLSGYTFEVLKRRLTQFIDQHGPGGMKSSWFRIWQTNTDSMGVRRLNMRRGLTVNQPPTAYDRLAVSRPDVDQSDEVWTTRDKKRVLVCDLHPDHARNIVRMFIRHLRDPRRLALLTIGRGVRDYLDATEKAKLVRAMREDDGLEELLNAVLDPNRV